MALTEHGHHIPITPFLAADRGKPALDCGGIENCESCRTDVVKARPQEPTIPCRFDDDLKRIKVPGGGSSTGKIVWCNAHQDRFAAYEGGRSDMCERAYRHHISSKVMKSVESIADLYASLGEIAREATVIFDKLAEAYKNQEN